MFERFVTPFLFFIAWLFLLLVTLSVPIIKSLNLFHINADVEVGVSIASASAKVAINYGIFGYCTSALNIQAGPFSQNTPAECSPKKLGYAIDPTVQRLLSAVQADDIVDVINKTLTFVLVLHPIACAFAFIALLLALLASFRANVSKSRIPSLAASGVGIFAALITTIVFIVDVVFVSIVKSKLKDHTDGAATANYGAAVWLVLVAALLLWVASLGACCGMLRARRARRTEAEKY
ncbi:hypothetical protein FRC01_014436 [Tulasnella sp. 417]|nr:hypothetical protein FRC01_014436 [Tulasnella sp. 417]